MGLARKLQREQMKQAYKLFVENWRLFAEKAEDGSYQSQGRKVVCPTFKQWVDACKRQVSQAMKTPHVPLRQEEKKVEEEFKSEGALEW
jgi:hypothetical protein